MTCSSHQDLKLRRLEQSNFTRTSVSHQNAPVSLSGARRIYFEGQTRHSELRSTEMLSVFVLLCTRLTSPNARGVLVSSTPPSSGTWVISLRIACRTMLQQKCHASCMSISILDGRIHWTSSLRLQLLQSTLPADLYPGQALLTYLWYLLTLSLL